MDETNRRRHLDNEERNENENIDLKRLRGVSGVDIADNLVPMISKVGENVTGSIEETLQNLSDILFEYLEPYEGQIIDILADCAMYLPEKLTNFTTIVGLINAKSANFGENIISKLITLLNDVLAGEEYDIVIRLVTFLADLGNSHVISITSIYEFLLCLVDLAVKENVRSDYFVYTVLHSLPWIGAELSEKKPEALDNLLHQINGYLSQRKKVHLKMLQVWSPLGPHQQLDSLDCLWAQIQKLKTDNWMEHHISRIYASFSATLKAGIAHNLPNIDPAVIITNKNMPLPRVVFRLFDVDDCADEQAMAPANSIERFLLEEDLNWIIDNNHLDWRLCAKALLNYHRRDFVPLNYAIVEVVFGQLFRLPSPPHLELFYGALMLELCHVRPNSLPQVLAQATELFYQRAELMQPICLDRFANWFSYHLSNFQYRWSWNDWVDCVELDTLHPRLMFMREVLEKCMRLSYHKRLTEFLPKELHAIIPPEPLLVDICTELTDTDMLNLANEIQALIEQRQPEQLFDLLKVDSSADTVKFSPDAVAIFTAVLLKLASKTFSHNFSALTKYHKIFRAVVQDNEEIQSVILRTLHDCWHHNKQVMTVLVDKMLKMQIVDPSVVQAWVFCDEMKREFKRTWVWDVLNTAVKRLELHCVKLTKEIRTLERRIEKLRLKKVTDNSNEPVEAPETAVQISDSNGEKPRLKILAPGADGDGVEPMEVTVSSMAEKEELINSLESKAADVQANLEEVEDNFRDVLLRICHKFTIILTEHLMNCDSDSAIDVETDFFNYVSGRFRHIFLAHIDSMWKFAGELDEKLFSSSSNIDPRILAIFKEFCALKQ